MTAEQKRKELKALLARQHKALKLPSKPDAATLAHLRLDPYIRRLMR